MYWLDCICNCRCIFIYNNSNAQILGKLLTRSRTKYKPSWAKLGSVLARLMLSLTEVFDQNSLNLLQTIFTFLLLAMKSAHIPNLSSPDLQELLIWVLTLFWMGFGIFLFKFLLVGFK